LTGKKELREEDFQRGRSGALPRSNEKKRGERFHDCGELQPQKKVLRGEKKGKGASQTRKKKESRNAPFEPTRKSLISNKGDSKEESAKEPKGGQRREKRTQSCSRSENEKRCFFVYSYKEGKRDRNTGKRKRYKEKIDVKAREKGGGKTSA